MTITKKERSRISMDSNKCIYNLTCPLSDNTSCFFISIDALIAGGIIIVSSGFLHFRKFTKKTINKKAETDAQHEMILP
jgi:hypothetical protein